MMLRFHLALSLSICLHQQTSHSQWPSLGHPAKRHNNLPLQLYESTSLDAECFLLSACYDEAKRIGKNKLWETFIRTPVPTFCGESSWSAVAGQQIMWARKRIGLALWVDLSSFQFARCTPLIRNWFLQVKLYTFVFRLVVMEMLSSSRLTGSFSVLA